MVKDAPQLSHETFGLLHRLTTAHRNYRLRHAGAIEDAQHQGFERLRKDVHAAASILRARFTVANAASNSVKSSGGLP